jgi:sigma-E factor negative regulatory protein RseA
MDKTRQENCADTRELASALADGELQGDELARALDVLRADEEAQMRWHTYHLVGDVMRSGASAPLQPHDPAFLAGLRQRLRDEASAPRRSVAHLTRQLPRPSANDSVWRWKLAAGLCSLAAVAMLGWQFATALRDEGAGVQLARSARPVSAAAQTTQLASAEVPVMIRDPQLDQLIAAHQQQGGTSALQMPAGFLRNATFERPAR